MEAICCDNNLENIVSVNQTFMLLFRIGDHKRSIIKSTDTNGMINSVIKALGGLRCFVLFLIYENIFLYFKSILALLPLPYCEIDLNRLLPTSICFVFFSIINKLP